MSALRSLSRACRVRAGVLRGLAVLLLGAAACDRPFEPIRKDDRPFSLYGHLDARADTQWIRVTPVRGDLLTEPGPIDAVVTLENLASGRTVTLRDSLLRFLDQRVDSAGYAHVFWTTERIEEGAHYRLRAARSDGAATTANVTVPDPQITVVYPTAAAVTHANPTRIRVRAERVLFADLIRLMWDEATNRPAPAITREKVVPLAETNTQEIAVRADTMRRPIFPPSPVVDAGRFEVRLAVTGGDWPYTAGLSNEEVVLPDGLPTTVENGLGFVGGVARWMVPIQTCWAIEARPNGQPTCSLVLDGRSASIRGRVVRQACSPPSALAIVRLTQRFAGGGAVVLQWKTGYDDTYHFEGLEPGADLRLEFDAGNPAPARQIPRLAAGQRYMVPDVPLPIGCR